MINYLRELNFVSVALRLLLSAVIGFSLGMERGRKRRPAGCRTYMLVCMGATLTQSKLFNLWNKSAISSVKPAKSTVL